jgi:hypothetical protein
MPARWCAPHPGHRRPIFKRPSINFAPTYRWAAQTTWWAAGPFANGRREINWDAVPDAFADTNQLPLNFFNNNSRRGALFATPGTSVSVSADSSNPSVHPTNFGGINASYRTNFQTFSPERLFSALGSTIVDVAFFVPNSPTNAATVNGFGAVFTDVEIAGSTKVEYL